MRQRHSDIFEEYLKLSIDQGLIKIAEEDNQKESKELKKYKSDSHPRSGSDDISTIEALYGVKPETIKGMEYDLNIIEVAHPNAVVVAPAYDKLNGLVENENERANIIRNKIMSAPASGTLALYKDAEKELMMELIRIGNDMDNADHEELRVLADSCLDGLKKKAGWLDDLTNWVGQNNFINKKIRDVGGIGEGAIGGALTGGAIGALVGAFFPPAIGASTTAGALSGAVIGAITAAIFNTSPKVVNIKENIKDTLSQLADLEKAIPEENAFFNTIKQTLTNLDVSADKYLEALNILQNKKDNINDTDKKAIEGAGNGLKESIEEFKNIKNEFNHKESMGIFNKAISKIPHFGLVSNDVEDVIGSLNSLMEAVENFERGMIGIGQKTVQENKKIDNSEPEKKPEPSQKKEEKGETNMDFSGLFELLGRKPTKEDLEFIKNLR